MRPSPRERRLIFQGWYHPHKRRQLDKSDMPVPALSERPADDSPDVRAFHNPTAAAASFPEFTRAGVSGPQQGRFLIEIALFVCRTLHYFASATTSSPHSTFESPRFAILRLERTNVHYTGSAVSPARSW